MLEGLFYTSAYQIRVHTIPHAHLIWLKTHRAHPAVHNFTKYRVQVFLEYSRRDARWSMELATLRVLPNSNTLRKQAKMPYATFESPIQKLAKQGLAYGDGNGKLVPLMDILRQRCRSNFLTHALNRVTRKSSVGRTQCFDNTADYQILVAPSYYGMVLHGAALSKAGFSAPQSSRALPSLPTEACCAQAQSKGWGRSRSNVQNVQRDGSRRERHHRRQGVSLGVRGGGD